MRNSALLKWASPGRSPPASAASNNSNAKNGNKNWIHAPDALQRGHIAYLVKFLGCTPVEAPKGIEVVKEGIRKLRFSQQLRKAEGTKTPKVELTISVDGVAVQEPRGAKRILHQFPLHRISYCADDKGEKRFFSFIAKEDAVDDQHACFVFVSDKLAEEITLTIGQAFDLAYRRFLETSTMEQRWQAQARYHEARAAALATRLQQVAALAGKDSVDAYLSAQGLTDLLAFEPPSAESNTAIPPQENGRLVEVATAPPVPPRAFELAASATSPTSPSTGSPLVSTTTTTPPSQNPVVGRKLEGLLLEEFDEDFNPRAFENEEANGNMSPAPLLAPPPKAVRRPTPAVALDPFGMDRFHGNLQPSPDADPRELNDAIGLLDRRLLEMKAGFSRGLSIGNDDFSLESLDPLRN